MWQLIYDCGKQLNIDYKVRQKIQEADEYITEYKVQEINIDEYVLHLESKLKNGTEVPVGTAETLVLTCEKILHYHFEVWTDQA